MLPKGSLPVSWTSPQQASIKQAQLPRPPHPEGMWTPKEGSKAL